MADITGTSGNDTLVGTSEADRIEGLAGNDFLDGGAGADLMIGGEGDDTYVIDEAGDEVDESIGQGFDIAYATASFALDAGAEVEVLAAADSGSTAALNFIGNEFGQQIFGNAGANVLTGGGGADGLYGRAGDDTYSVDASDVVFENAGEGFDQVYSLNSFTLNAGAEVEVIATGDSASAVALNLTGNEYGQQIIGNAGANVLTAGGGADGLYGLGGDDIYSVDNLDVVVENAGQGFDQVYALTSFALSAGAEVEVIAAGNSASTAALNLSGNEYGQSIIGNAGANVLSGGGGADGLYGLGGDDIYSVDGQDAVIESAGQGFDQVYATTSFNLNAGASIEVLAAGDSASTSALNLAGNEFGQQIFGNAGANVLTAGGGADGLHGLGGDDIYSVDGQDAVFEGVGLGFDQVYSLTSFTLNAGAEVEVIAAGNSGSTAALNLTGNEYGQTIFGNAGANVLTAGGGADTLYGFGGDDIYSVDGQDAVVESAGQGFDQVYSSASFTLAAGASVEVLAAGDSASTVALSLTGNELGQQLFGNAGANILDGGASADSLTGGGGADTFAFTTALGGGNIDAIADFQTGIDKIRLGGAAGQPFAALASDTLRAGAFVVGSAALQADDYIIYNSATGALLYDADGNSTAVAAVQFATLASGLGLTAADFIVSGPANNPPAITSGGAVSVPENSPASTIVYQTTATDADGDRITYSLSGSDAALLNIDAVTGAVRLNSAPDFETKASYSFNVVASDSGTSPTQAVTLTITDVADTGTPIINETGSPNDSTGTAQAIDRGIFTVAANPNLPDASLPSATIVGNLPNQFDEDFFSITLQAGEKLILDVDNSSGNLDSHVHVFNSAGALIGGNDDPGFLDPGSEVHEYGHNTDSLFSFRAPTSDIYYFSIESFQDVDNPTFGSYQLHVSIGPPATEAELLAEMIAADIQALIRGPQWPTANITYSFPNSAADYAPDFGDDEPASLLQFTGTQQAATQQMLQHISNVSLLTFQQLSGFSDGDAKLRFAMTDATEAAHAYFPGNSNEAGSAWFNKQDFLSPQRGTYDWMGILHEIGHTLGLDHAHENPPTVSPGRDSLEYTVMTYRSFPGQDLSGGGAYTNETWGYPQSLMMYDIAALQKIYGGANYNFNFGDTQYSWNPNTGELSINFSGQGAPGANRIFMTIWDGNGTDTYDFQSYTTPVTIDLRPGEWSQTGSVQLANLGLGHFARGNIANALLFNDDPRSLIENARGGSGGDTLIANRAANNLMGWQGADTYKWMASTDAGTGVLADTIDGLTHGSDKIDLSNIDANPGTTPNDAFAFIGASAFTSVAGELRYQVEGGNVRIQTDLDGNGVADMEIIVTGTTTLTAADFIL